MSSKLRVMVVDDSALNRRTIGDVLGALDGVEVVGKAADGDEALRLAQSLAPDLITLDLEMPRMDGFTFLRLLMARQPTAVIVISGSGRESVGRAMELGAVDCVAKGQRDGPGIELELAEKVAALRAQSVAGRPLLKRPLPQRFPTRTPFAPERPAPVEKIEREKDGAGLTRLVVI
ncbi:MAG TPA: response regulator, partial [Polyangiales bacterium]|nr:response regulator [Polyangiales bacterium]